MNADPADLLRLLDIAGIDSGLAREDAARRHPPQAVRVRELLATRQSLAQELARRQNDLDAVRSELGRVEADVAVVEARRARDASLLASTSSAKDAVGLEHELASLARRQHDLEDAQLELMERQETAAAAVDEQQSLIAEANAEGARLSAEAKDAVAEATIRHEQLTRDRAALAATVPAELLALYERLAQRSTGVALVRARTCLGCHMVLSGSDLSALRAAPENLVVTCPECGCILVRTGESGL